MNITASLALSTALRAPSGRLSRYPFRMGTVSLRLSRTGPSRMETCSFILVALSSILLKSVTSSMNAVNPGCMSADPAVL